MSEAYDISKHPQETGGEDLSGLEQTVESLARFPEENPNPVMRVSPRGRVLYGNSTAKKLWQIFGIELHEMLPFPFPAKTQAIFRGGVPGLFDAEIGPKTYAFNATPVVKAGYLNLYGHDVTTARDMRIAKDVAVRTAKSKSEFLASMSHEIRTPMNGIMGMAQLLSHTQLTEKQSTFTNIILKSSVSLLNVINDILDFSKIEAGKFTLTEEEFDLTELVEDVAVLLATQTTEKNLEILVRIDQNIPQNVTADAGRIRQILLNIMGNAVKFTEEGHVIVDVKNETLRTGQHRLTFRVIDSGVGIAEDQCERVFEKFSQVDGSKTRKHDGTGLGLTIAASLVELMDGTISVRSKLGKGSVFTFDILVRPSELVGSVPTIAKEISALILGPNKTNGLIIKEALEAWGCKARACLSFNEALGAMKTESSFDMMIIDAALVKDAHGYEGLVAKARGNDRVMPIVMMNSIFEMNSGVNVYSGVVMSTLLKPVRMKELRQIVSDISIN